MHGLFAMVEWRNRNFFFLKLDQEHSHRCQDTKTLTPNFYNTTFQYSRLADSHLSSGFGTSKLTRNRAPTKEQQQAHASGWQSHINDMTDIRKPNANTNPNNLNNNSGDDGDDKSHSAINNNNNDKFSINNNNNTGIVTAADAGYSGSKVHRMRSISVVNQRGATIDGCGGGGGRGVGCGPSMLVHSHCLANVLAVPTKAKCQTHPHRSRSKTVSCELHKCHTHDVLIKRRSCQHSVGAKPQLLDADHLNGNVVEGLPCTARDMPARLLQRNRSQVSSRYIGPQPQLQASHSPQATKTAIANHLIKRGKRTLSSTQIEREKADEKSVKVIKKHAALRSLSPLLGANTRSAKKAAAPTLAK